MKYVIEYEHLMDELVTNEKARWNFNQVKDSANKYRLDKVQKDVGWVMHKMSAYELSFTDALITYITY